MSAPLWTAQPCDVTDPAPGVRLLRAGERQQRLTVSEALGLVNDLITAIINAPDQGASDGEGLAIWALVQAAGHLDCGSWSFDSRDDHVTCRCTAVIPVATTAAGNEVRS